LVDRQPTVVGKGDAMYEGTPKRVDLRPEDRDRMQRLSEEVQGRLKEMSLIAGRTLGITLGNEVRSPGVEAAR
jgi:hypothetical protein